MNRIVFDKTSLWYGEVIALNEVSFQIGPGITGLVGSNGAGKTSCIKLAASLLKPTIGTVTIDGEDIWQNLNYMKKMGYSPEIDRQFGFMTGEKFLDFAGKLHNIPTRERKQKITKILEQVGMSHAAKRKISGYSRGMRQRIKVGQSLINDPQILLADEPLSGTDPIGRNIMIKIFQELVEDQDTTIIVSSHVLHELERISKRIIVLESGKLVAEGRVNDVRTALHNIPQQLKIVTNNAVQFGEAILHIVKGLEIIDDSTIIVEVDNRRLFAEQMMAISNK